jgi:hypothetical protein
MRFEVYWVIAHVPFWLAALIGIASGARQARRTPMALGSAMFLLCSLAACIMLLRALWLANNDISCFWIESIPYRMGQVALQVGQAAGLLIAAIGMEKALSQQSALDVDREER